MTRITRMRGPDHLGYYKFNLYTEGIVLMGLRYRPSNPTQPRALLTPGYKMANGKWFNPIKFNPKRVPAICQMADAVIAQIRT